MLRALLFATCLLLVSFPAGATTAEEYLDGPSGVSISFHQDGSLRKLVSVAEAGLEGREPHDIHDALEKATIKAKAQIVRFMNERVITEEVLDGISTLSPGTNAIETRQPAKTRVTTIRSHAQALLRGVVVVATHIKHFEKRVQVIVATDPSHIHAAQSLQQMMQ